MSFVQGILMALLHKARTGEGQRMDTSQVGATIQFQGQMLTSVLHLGGRQPDNEVLISEKNFSPGNLYGQAIKGY